jgi:hypothetical protein
MLLGGSFKGLEDLPILGPETPVVTNRDIRNGAFKKAAGPTLIRTVTIGAEVPANLDGFNLVQLLAVTDEELDIVADFCQAEVVNHPWGLYEIPDTEEARAKFGADRINDMLHPNLKLPDDHILVAKVDVIKHAMDARFSPTSRINIRRGLRTYDERPNRHKLRDIKTDQFLRQYKFGIPSRQRSESLKLVDIEPRFY